MEKIMYPVYGIISAPFGREVNYLITEKEYCDKRFRSEKEVKEENPEEDIIPEEELSLECFHEARKYVLKNEKELLDFIHGKYNDMKKAEENPEWYWQHVIIAQNEGELLWKAIKEFGLSYWNLKGYYRGEQPVTRVQSRVVKGPSELTCFASNYWSVLFDVIEGTGLFRGDRKSFHIDVESADETIGIYFYVIEKGLEAEMTVTRRTADGIEVIPLMWDSDSYYYRGRFVLRELTPEWEYVIREYIIDIENDAKEQGK